jgi:two-component system, OmpR family, sensor kinase
MIAGGTSLVMNPRSWTLASRLVATVVLLLAALSLVVGAASLIAAQHYLDGQLHEQLTNAAGGQRRDGNHVRPPLDGQNDTHIDDNAPVGFLNKPGTAIGTISASITRAGVTEVGVVPAYGAPLALDSNLYPVFASLPADNQDHVVDVPGYGDYVFRLVAAPSAETGLTPNPDVKLFVGLPRSGVAHVLDQVALVIAVVAVFGLVAAALIGTLLVKRALLPLRRVAATAARVSELPLNRRDVALAVRVPDLDTDPRTEVGQVGASLNRMLGTISDALAARTASEERMRRFVADASHELRTPLASIRGYAELTRRHGVDLPPDVGHAVGRVESEAVRMTGLVEDLLLLARLDESPEAAALKNEDVDLTEIAINCVGDAHLLSPDHKWLLDLPDEPVVATGDSARLQQVLTNLLANARTHTPAGTTVTVRLKPAAGTPRRVVLEVDDNGPGIPAELQPEVFERFARADTSRSRAAGSTGLGLSIVASVVGAHNGSVAVTSEPGHTLFTVDLPAGR